MLMTEQRKIHLSAQVSLLRPNKELSVFRVTSLEILGRLGTHIQ